MSEIMEGVLEDRLLVSRLIDDEFERNKDNKNYIDSLFYTKYNKLFERLNASDYNTARDKLEKAIKDGNTDVLLKAYAAELLTGKKIIEPRTPFAKSAEMIFNHRLDNLELYKKVNNKLAETLFGPDYMTKYAIKDNYMVKDLPTISNRGNENCFPFAFDDNFRNNLIYNVEKYLIMPPVVSKSHNTTYVKSYYVGRYINQNVIFSEVISLPKEYDPKGRNKSKQLSDFDMTKCSYSLSTILQGKKRSEMLLFRYDYLPVYNHINKIENGKLNVFENFISLNDCETQRQRILVENVAPGHLHKLTYAYSLVFPNSLGACDCSPMSLRFDSHTDFINYNRKNSKVETRYVLFKENDKNYFKKSIAETFEQFLEKNQYKFLNN